MTLKETILKKIKIKDASKAVAESIRTIGDSRIDKKNAIILLESSGYTHEHLRDINLYYKGIDPDKRLIIVLDSEFATYNTSLEDVAIRKSPTIKEMLSIGNVKKILWDEGVILQKKTGTLETITREAIERLEIVITKKSVEEIMYQAMASLAEGHDEGIMEGLMIFSELLEWSSPQVSIKTPSVFISGKIIRDSGPENNFGPALAYNRKSREIGLTEKVYGLFDENDRSAFEKFANENIGADIIGENVFRRLNEMVQSKYGL